MHVLKVTEQRVLEASGDLHGHSVKKKHLLSIHFVLGDLLKHIKSYLVKSHNISNIIVLRIPNPNCIKTFQYHDTFGERTCLYRDRLVHHNVDLYKLQSFDSKLSSL